MEFLAGNLMENKRKKNIIFNPSGEKNGGKLFLYIVIETLSTSTKKIDLTPFAPVEFIASL